MWVVLNAFEVPAVGELASARAAGRALVVANHGGCLHALDDRCPHAGVALSQMGTLCEGQVVCGWHGASIDVATGRCEGFPDVQAYPVEVRSDGVYVRVDDQAMPPDDRSRTP